MKNRSAEKLRRQAEERLKKSKTKAATPLTPEEMQRLIQELEVHQVELDMQNEELQQARVDLERSLSQYTDLYDFAPVGYFTVDQEGVILKVNLTGARMLGIERNQILSRQFDQYIDAEYRNEFLSFVEKVFLDHNQGAIEIALQKKGHGALYVHVEAIASEDGQECRLAFVDISAQKKAEIERQESERQYRILFETMMQGVVYQDLDGKILSANPAAEKILGLSIQQMQGRIPQDLHWKTIHEDESDFSEETHPSMVALRTGEIVNNVLMGFYSQQSGNYRWLNVTAVPQFRPGEDRPFQVFMTLEDITYIKRLETFNRLTSREKEVINLLVKGHSRKKIAEILKVSPKTADKHKENLMEKLKLYTTKDLIKFTEQIRLV